MPLQLDAEMLPQGASHQAADSPPVASRKTLWIMRRDAYQIEAAMACMNGEWELRLMDHVSLITWRRFRVRSLAVAWADLFQQDLERDGWQ